jgi:hypothetical protein
LFSSKRRIFGIVAALLGVAAVVFAVRAITAAEYWDGDPADCSGSPGGEAAVTEVRCSR